MLPRDGAARLDAKLHDLRAGTLDPPDLLVIGVIEQQVRMKVAVSGVEEVGDRQVVLRGGVVFRTGKPSVKFCPPLVITDEAIVEGAAAVEEAVERLVAS